MHFGDERFWDYAARTYPDHFRDPAEVLEVGSFNINGSIRKFFRCQTYIGVDWRPGPDVDVVSLAHEMWFDRKFHTIASASMLEHDPHWKLSLARMCELLSPDGGLFLTWGAALNPCHCLQEAPDHLFHALPAGLAIRHLEGLGMHIREFRYQDSDSFLRDAGMRETNVIGGVCLIAFRTPGPSILDTLKPEDSIFPTDT